MASEGVYAEVSPKERVNFVSKTSDTGDPVTYAEVNVNWRPHRADSTPKIPHSVPCLENWPWCFVVFALLFSTLVLLITVVLLAVKCYSL